MGGTLYRAAPGWHPLARPRLLAVLLAMALACGSARGMSLTIETPGGPLSVDIGHVAPEGDLVSPAAPTPPPFRPPTIFSAPLPSGSGARALGLAGGFTALADDATAASWNPGGLIQLERPEASVVWRASREDQGHHSDSPDYMAGDDDFGNANLNYLSLACPFRLLGRHVVASLNYQEAYDFTQQFTARDIGRSSERESAEASSVFSETSVAHYEEQSSTTPDGIIIVDVTSNLRTEKTTIVKQALSSDSVTSLDFEQDGVIAAATPALAWEVTPRLALGAAVNFYGEDWSGANPVRSRTRAAYSGETSNGARVTDTLRTTGDYAYEGVIYVPPGGIIPVPIEVPISGSGEYPEFSESSSRSGTDVLPFEGSYEEDNSYDDLFGVNATIGALCALSRHLSLGANLDLPWSADASQTKTVRNTITRFDESRTRIVDRSVTESSETRDVSFTFPLYWAVGAVWRWNNLLYTTLDVSQTRWSDFAFRAEGEGRLNPFDGSPLGVNDVDDCWAARCGTEYLLVLSRTEIPLRVGFAWDQRPAVGKPDEYRTVTAGTGISLGRDPGKLIVDVAYSFTWADDVLGSLVAGQSGLTTDVRKHECYVSTIWHF